MTGLTIFSLPGPTLQTMQFFKEWRSLGCCQKAWFEIYLPCGCTASTCKTILGTVCHWTRRTAGRESRCCCGDMCDCCKASEFVWGPHKTCLHAMVWNAEFTVRNLPLNSYSPIPWIGLVREREQVMLRYLLSRVKESAFLRSPLHFLHTYNTGSSVFLFYWVYYLQHWHKG